MPFPAGSLGAVVSSQISHFKIPRYIVFVDQYPLTISGKVRDVLGQDGSSGLLFHLLSESPFSSLHFIPDSEIQAQGTDGEAPSALSWERQSKKWDKSAPLQPALGLFHLCLGLCSGDLLC